MSERKVEYRVDIFDSKGMYAKQDVMVLSRSQVDQHVHQLRYWLPANYSYRFTDTATGRSVA